MKYYSLGPILKYKCLYNFIFGERSNGKSYACLLYGLERYLKQGYEIAVIRRYRENFKSKRGASMFNSLVKNEKGENVVKKLTHGEYDRITYYAGRWFLAKWDEKLQRAIAAPNPFAYSFALTEMESDKSTSYPNIRTIIFDEVISRDGYINNEWIYFRNVCSTIIRNLGPEDGFKIFMLGNTVNKFCPYFAEMHLKNIQKMKPGDIDIYRFGTNGLTVAVEYAEPSARAGKKKSDVFFDFDDSSSAQMITRGAWEIGTYPHNMTKYEKKDILFMYFIEWEGNLLQCEIVSKENRLFTFIHIKTTELQDPDRDILFSIDYHQKLNCFRNIANPATKMQKKIWWFFASDNVYYQDNEVGEIVNNYLNWCRQNR